MNDQLNRIENKLNDLVSAKFCDERHRGLDQRTKEDRARIIKLERGQGSLQVARAGLLGSWKAILAIISLTSLVAMLAGVVVAYLK